MQLPPRAPRTLLALLLMHRDRPLSAEQLADGLWGERQPASADSALHVHLSKVRATVGDLLLREPAGYLLDPTRWELDAQRFLDLLIPVDPGTSSAIQRLEQALTLWRGAPLEDLVPDGRLGEWAGQLAEQRLRAEIALLQARVEVGGSHELLPKIEALITENPFEEQLWALSMIALYRAGRQAEALDAYQRARRRFAEELGIDPGPALQAVHARVLDHDPGLMAAVEGTDAGRRGAARQAEARSPLSLPAQMTTLVGREYALEELARICARPTCRLLTLVGTGGIGKTRLAIEHARRWSESFRDGVAFVDLSAVTTSEGIQVEVARSLARCFDDARSVTAAGVEEYLRGRELLLVLDNFEQVRESGPAVSRLLAACPGVAAIVTSRVPLRLRGEHLYDVPPLAVSAIGDPAAGPAVELFIQGAVRVDPHFEADPDQREPIAAICRALDGLPLGIELASARVRTHPVAEIATRLASPLRLGAVGLGDLPDRQQTLEAALRWSFDLLSQDARRLLLGTAVLEGPFTSEAIAAVTQIDAGPGLLELQEASLVQLGETPGRYRVTALVRDFARGQLLDMPEFDREARDAHLRYFSEHYAAVVADRLPPDTGVVALQYGPDHADLRAAVARATARGDARALPPLLWGLEPIWVSGFLEEAGVIADQVLRLVELEPGDEVRLLLAASLATAGRPEGMAWTRRARSRATELGRSGPALASLMRLCALAMESPQAERALLYRDELLAVPDEGLSRSLRAGRSMTLAACHYLEGDLVAAAREAQQAVISAKQWSNAHTQALCLNFALFCASAWEGRIPVGALRELVTAAAGVLALDNVVATLWLVSRYAVEFEPGFAAELLGLAERLTGDGLGDFWPENELRTETLAALGDPDPRRLAEEAPAHDAPGALALAADWLAHRRDGESAPRTLLKRPGYRLTASVEVEAARPEGSGLAPFRPA